MDNIYAYDLEVYKNFFSAVFVNVNDEVDVKTFLVFEERNDLSQLIEFITNTPDLTLVGHNSLGYDDPILRAILKYPNIKTIDLKRLSDNIIDDIKFESFRKRDIWYELRYPKTTFWDSIDLMEMFRINKKRPGLKYVAVVLKHKKLQDLPIPHDAEIQSNQVEGMLKYNRNDVFITIEFYKYAKDERQTRLDVEEVFQINAKTLNRTAIGKEIFNKVYAEKTGLKYQYFKKLRTPRENVIVKECLPDNILFHTEHFQKLKTEFESWILYECDDYKKYTQTFFDDVKYDLGVGGIHSVDGEKPGVFRTDEQVYIIDLDINSFYPVNQLNNNFFPEHLGEKFPEVFRWIVDTRLDAKSKKHENSYMKTLAGVLKIPINSEYGLTNSKYYWLYDPKVMVSVTISGQLYILDLIEKLYLADIHTLSANTDGITCFVPKNKLKEYREVTRKWEKRTNFGLEFNLYLLYCRRDVNNYLTIKKFISLGEEGELSIPNIKENWQPTPNSVKTKGAFVPGVWDKEGGYWKQPVILGSNLKAYTYPVVPLALYEYYVNNIPIEDTILNHKDIYDFMICPRVGKGFETYFKYIKKGEIVKEKLQKTNRYIVTNYGGSLYKIKGDRRYSLCAGENTQVCNDVLDDNIDNYDLKKEWYINEAQKIIDIVELPKQVSLFEGF